MRRRWRRTGTGITLWGLFVAFGVVAEGLAVLSCVLTLRDYSRDRRSLEFKPAPAVVTEVLTRAHRPRRQRWTDYQWSIHYSYVIGDVKYTSSQVTFGDEWHSGGNSLKEAHALGSQKYPVGREVTAHYDASRPQYAVLVVRQPSLDGLVVAGIFAALGVPSCVAGVVWARRRLRHQGEAVPTV